MDKNKGKDEMVRQKNMWAALRKLLALILLLPVTNIAMFNVDFSYLPIYLHNIKKKSKLKVWGVPHFWPLKKETFLKRPTMTAYNPHLQNIILL